MEKPSSSIKFYGVGNDKWLGIVLSNSAQRTQIEGTGGFGLRVKVAIMGFHSSEEGELADDEITYALVQLGVTDGTGATNRQRTIRLTQGDVVTGEFLDGSARQQPVVTGCLGRTSGTRYGKGRFESKTGFEGKNKALGLLGKQKQMRLVLLHVFQEHFLEDLEVIKVQENQNLQIQIKKNY
tara:strand:- start:122 stop:667 length:546 start_codon:yes stop_codon:yes gene_type:complete